MCFQALVFQLLNFLSIENSLPLSFNPLAYGHGNFSSFLSDSIGQLKLTGVSIVDMVLSQRFFLLDEH